MVSYRVIQISRVRLNPYVRLLQAALVEAGVPCSTIERLTPRTLPSRPDTRLVVHLHWLELQFASATCTSSLRRLLGLVSALVLLKLRGARLVYTVHNLSPHEQSLPVLSRVASRLVFGLADALHVHDETVRVRVAQHCGTPKKVHVVPHGSYIGAYPNSCTRQEARAKLQLPEDAFIYLCLGQVRRYKGVQDLISAFGQLPAGNQQLVLAGHVHDTAYAQQLALTTEALSGIHTWFSYVDDAEVQYFMQACDVCVLPYRDMTTSGAAILAFSFGKPIVAPALGGFPELADAGRGIVYDPQQKDGLLLALLQARSTDMAAAGQKALSWATEHDWRILVPRFIEIYEGALGTRQRIGNIE